MQLRRCQTAASQNDFQRLFLELPSLSYQHVTYQIFYFQNIVKKNSKANVSKFLEISWTKITFENPLIMFTCLSLSQAKMTFSSLFLSIRRISSTSVIRSSSSRNQPIWERSSRSTFFAKAVLLLLLRLSEKEFRHYYFVVIVKIKNVFVHLFVFSNNSSYSLKDMNHTTTQLTSTKILLQKSRENKFIRLGGLNIDS